MSNKYSIEPEMNTILQNVPISIAESTIGGFLGFIGGLVLPNPIAWVLEPFIKLWTIQAEIKRIKLQQEQIELAAQVAIKKIESTLKREQQKLKEAKYMFDVRIVEFQNLMYKHGNQTNKILNQVDRLINMLEYEDNPISKIALHKSIDIAYKAIVPGNVELCNCLKDICRDVSQQTKLLLHNKERLLGV